ncbi:MAG: hypothetical protein JSR66_06730 [Proteobacteria bacterium]|nr:hypothetical protein [Pseudomonadota bacterium]
MKRNVGTALVLSVWATAGIAAGAAATSVAPQTGALANPLSALPAAGAKNPNGCLASGDGYLRARIRGALVLDVNLRNAELECDGGPRPDGSGIRVSFAGPARSDGRRLRMVFGVGKAKEGALGRELPTNLTVIFEGEQRMFATRGDDKCTVDEFKQERVGALGGPIRTYRVIARGFCIAPVKALNSEQTILVNSFDFAGNITFEDAPPNSPK